MKNATIQIKQEKDNSARIIMEDELSIQTVEDATEKLKDTVDTYEHFTFELDKVNNLDLAYIQLLLSFKQTAEESGKHVDFKLNLSDELKELLKKAGLDTMLPLE